MTVCAQGQLWALGTAGGNLCSLTAWWHRWRRLEGWVPGHAEHFPTLGTYQGWLHRLWHYSPVSPRVLEGSLTGLSYVSVGVGGGQLNDEQPRP